MKYDIILAGVGGQGVLSISALIATAAMDSGLHVKQAEVHGMAQRGGAVQSNLRLSDQPIASDLIPRHTADLILSMEPVESLRYLDYLHPEGTVVASTDPVENVHDYPELDGLLEKIRGLPRSRLVEAGRLAREAGNARATNMAMVGGAAGLLPVDREAIEEAIRKLFGQKGEKIVEANLKAFRAGIEAVEA